MPDSVRVKVSGLHELGEALREMGQFISGPIAVRSTAAAAKVIKNRAIELAPAAEFSHKIEGVEVPPGNLKKNIVVKRIKPGETTHSSEHIVTVRGKAAHGYASRYGSMVEYGTVKMAAHSFMRTAWDWEQGAAAAAMIDVLKKGVAKASGDVAVRTSSVRATNGSGVGGQMSFVGEGFDAPMDFGDAGG